MQVCTEVSGKAALIASGKPLRPSTRHDVFDPAIAQIVHYREPKFGPFIGRDPEPQNLTFALRNAQGHVYSLVLDLTAFRVGF